MVGYGIIRVVAKLYQGMLESGLMEVAEWDKIGGVHRMWSRDRSETLKLVF